MSVAIRWGILGAAKIARTDVAPAIHLADGAQLTALASRTPDRAAAFVEQYPGLRVLESYDALLADPTIDAIYIPLPNHLHVEWTERALRAGKNVLCEKPIALKYKEINRLIAARDDTGLMAAEAFMVVHHPQWQRVRALVAEGAIGDLVGVDGVFHYNNPDPANIRNRAETGGGGLFDIGVYPSVVTRFVTGQEPGEIAARVDWDGGVDVMARVWAEFQEFTLSFSCGMRQAPRQEMTFHGTEGWLRLPAPFNAGRYGAAQIHRRMKDGTEVIESFHDANHYRLMIEAFGRAIRGEEFACPLEFSRGNQAMIDRIFEAAKA